MKSCYLYKVDFNYYVMFINNILCLKGLFYSIVMDYRQCCDVYQRVSVSKNSEQVMNEVYQVVIMLICDY